MQYDDLIAAAETQYGIPPGLGRAVVLHESRGDPLAVGDGGAALGLMQVHTAAAMTAAGDGGQSWAQLKALIDQGDRDGAAQLGLDLGMPYLASMLARFKDQEWSLAAYNQGPTVMGKGRNYAAAVLALVTSGGS